MTSTLKLILVLFYLQTGQGRRLRPLNDQKGETVSALTSTDWTKPGEGVEAGTQMGVKGQRMTAALRRRRFAADSPCSLRSVLLQVRDLGLGYDSDESVLFKYCGGSCPHVRSNHDLTLTNLLLSGVLPQPPPGQLWHHAPCCRPTHHEDMAFLDNAHRWHKVEQLSAADCACVG